MSIKKKKLKMSPIKVVCEPGGLRKYIGNTWEGTVLEGKSPEEFQVQDMAIFESPANILNQGSGDIKFRVTSVKTMLEVSRMRAQRESTKWEEKRGKKEEFYGRKFTPEIQRKKVWVFF